MTTPVFNEAAEADPVAVELAGLLDDMETAARVREGDTLGETDGVRIKASKSRSMVHRNGVDLPPRTRVYDRRGFPSDVPTAQLGYHLGKKSVEGERVFFSKPPAGVKIPEPIDVDCEWCTRRAGKSVKKFYAMDDYEAHCELLHPREWASKQRREDRAGNVASVGDILKILGTMTPEQRKSLIGEA